jgi:hypothetical protein
MSDPTSNMPNNFEKRKYAFNALDVHLSSEQLFHNAPTSEASLGLL